MLIIFKKHLLPIVLLINFIAFNACKKEQTAFVAPSITATSPAENEQLLNGDTVNIKGQVNDPEGLTTLEIKVTNDDNGAVLYTNAPKVTDLKSFTIDIPWKISVDGWLTTTMTITATNKHNLKTDKQIHFKIWQ
jgi:hypothetical protein